MDDLKLLKNHLEELLTKLHQHIAIRDRIETEEWRGTKRQLSIGITHLETAILFFNAAVESEEAVPGKRWG